MPRMNKVTRVLTYVNARKNTPRTARYLYNAQDRIVEAIATPEYWDGYDAILKRHGYTRESFFDLIHNPELYSFYSLGLKPHQKPVNDEIASYCRSQGMFNPDWQFTTFTAHLYNAFTRGQILRQGKKGSYKYYLPS